VGEALAENIVYRHVYEFILSVFGSELAWLAYAIATFSVVLLVVNVLMLLATFYTWAERRLLGRFTNRLGPNRAGPFGLLQALADAVKLLTKEDIVPRSADRWVFNIAPIVMLGSVLMAMGVIPLGEKTFLADLNIGLLYLVAVSGLGSIAVLMAGYASANKFSTFGAMRAAAVLISYEIPLVMSLLSITILAGSMSLIEVVNSQTIPFLLVTPLAAFIFLTAMSAELNRSPFDITEGESEIVAGYLTEYSGMKFGTFMLAEFAALMVAGAVFAVLFLQGWKWAILPSHIWMLLKVGLFALLATWVRSTLPRLRPDQILTFAWKFLFPLSLINVIALSVQRLLLADEFGNLQQQDMWLMVVSNWILMVVAVPVLIKITNRKSGIPFGESAKFHVGKGV
tara:strand:- start:7163 stop:8356 length:1194 start_codon:yes stop_codon:yes gene_type:complete